MKTKVGRILRMVWLCMACLGLLPSQLPAQEPKLRATLKPNTVSQYDVAYSPDSKMLASASGSWVKLWELATGKEQAA